MTRSLLLSMLFLFSAEAFGRQLILFGGGGDPKDDPKTIFDDALKDLDGYLGKNQWEHRIVFNGGHSETDKSMKELFPKAKSRWNFNENNYSNLINYYIQQLKDNKIPAGEQLMIMMGTHGAPQMEKETTHGIAVGRAPARVNPSTLTGTRVISMDNMKELADLAEKKGVKLAIVDFSCHSGSSLGLANKNTCVISSSGPKHFGYTDFAETFIKNMKEGKSLEDVFLETRKANTTHAFPMISTPEGQSINRDIYPGITPFLYYESNDRLTESDKLSQYLISASKDCIQCRDEVYSQFMKNLDNLKQAAAANASKNIPEIETLKSLIADYKKAQDEQLKFISSKSADLNKVETFNIKASSGKYNGYARSKHSWAELLTSNYDKLIANLEAGIKTEPDGLQKAEMMANLELYKTEKAKREEIITARPDLNNYRATFQQSLRAENMSLNKAKEISLVEKKIYNEIYASIKKDSQSNPCRDFKL